MEDYKCQICQCSNHKVILSGIRDWEYGVDGLYGYNRCLECKSVQINPFPKIEDLVAAYDIDYHGYTNSADKGFIYGALYKVQNFFFKRSLHGVVNKSSVVLDVGCGNGEFLARLKPLGVEKLYGIDFNERAVELATSHSIKVFKGVFSQYSSSNITFDTIFMNNYLEHTLDPKSELLKAKSLLSPNGFLIGEVPNFNSIDRHLFNRYWGGNHVPRHTFQFEPATLKNLLKEAGFHEIKITQEINTCHLALSIQNFLQRNKPNLRKNSSIHHGRAQYYNFLLLLLLPINIVFSLLGYSGVMKFRAK